MRINDIRPKSVMDSAREAYSRDLNFYKSNVHEFQARTCPAGCKTYFDLNFIEQEGFNFSRCRICFSIFMNPGPSEDLVTEFYQRSENYKYWAKYVYPTSKQNRKTLLSKPRAGYVLDSLDVENIPQKKLRVLELGAGSGEVLESLIEKINGMGLEVDAYVYEPNPDMDEFYQNKKYSVIKGSFFEAARKLVREGIGFDLVYAFEVVEHLLNPKSYFLSISELLRDGGNFVFSTPNALSAEVLLLRGKSTTIDIEHISLLTPLSVFSMAAQCGFSVERVETPGKLDLELMSDKNVLSRLIYYFFSKTWPSLLNKLAKLISENLLSSHSRYSLQKHSKIYT